MLDLSPKRNRFSHLQKALLFSLAVLIVFKGGTFAANININTSNALEYGQGISALTACSGNTSINIRPVTNFSNGSGSSGEFKFASFEVTNVPSSCDGSKFIFSAYDSSTGTALALYDSTAKTVTVIKKTDSTYQLGTGLNGISLTTVSASAFTVTFASPVSTANRVYKLTIQSATAVCADGYNCAIGDTGPGGGVVFALPTTAGNSTGQTFEVATTDLAGTYAMCSLNSVSGLSLSNNFGYGETNTAVLNANSSCNGSTLASYAASHYSGGGLNDWFLPSANELKMVKDNVITVFSNRSLNYMTSSQNSANSIWFVNMSGSSMCGGGYWPLCTSYKDDSSLSVRAVRSF